ncbi:hypothetical protein CHS0354_029779 [Potamilus streckersoni]|uniref:Uncharacterized protein n=1 Tax=Potamilus streckersoni TaxID=2493646 RepID=A0AAE0TIM7_9BIVA|nr:hypothetical protein CHS0354_029779 [Potamilus streckersoni]
MSSSNLYNTFYSVQFCHEVVLDFADIAGSQFWIGDYLPMLIPELGMKLRTTNETQNYKGQKQMHHQCSIYTPVRYFFTLMTEIQVYLPRVGISSAETLVLR